MDPSSLLLSRLIETSWFSPCWKDLRWAITNEIGNHMRLHIIPDSSLEKLIVLQICGEEMRKQWKMQEDFHPELLMEPYVSTCDMNVLQSKVESLLFQRVARMVCTMEMDDVRYIDTLLNGLPNLHMNDKDGLSTRNNALLLHRFRKHVVRVYYDLLPIIISTIPKTLNTHALDNAGMRKINSSCSSRDFVVRNEIENTLQESDQTASASNADKVDALDSVVEVCSRINQLSNALLISFANQDIVSSVKFNYSNMISEPLTAASVVSTQAFADGNYLSDQGNSCALKNTAVLSRDRKEGVPLLGLSCERLHPLDYSADAYDINDMLSKYDKLEIDYVCKKTIGLLLAPSMRQFLLAYRCLYRGSLGDSKNGDLGISSNMKNPGRNNISICVNELLKQGALRGYHNIIDKCPHSEFIHRTVSQYVTLFTVQSTTAKHMPFNIENNNKLGIQEPTSIDRSITPEIQKLVARTEHLVFSSFVSTGSMSPRIVAIATLLMSVFTNESPVSEKILRIYRRILNEILPSEQLHRDYSTANISIKAWNLLFQRDPELYHHLQKHALEYDFVSLHVDEGSTLNSGTASGGAPETQLNPEMSEERIPQCSSNDKEQDTENLRRLAMPLLVEYALDVRSGSGTAKSRVEISTSNSNSKIHEKSTSSVNSDTAIATSPPSDGNTGHISLAIDKKSLLNHKRTKQQSDIDSENNNKSGVNSLGSATPPALYMLKGWLECGFCGGWFNSYTSLYIWDVLLCFGWDYESGITTTGSNTHTSTHSPAVVENMLPIICCILLQLLREPLLANKSENFIFVLLREGRKIRTKRVVESMQDLIRSDVVHVKDNGCHQKYAVFKEQMKKFHEAENRRSIERGFATDTIHRHINEAIEKIVKEVECKGGSGPVSRARAKSTVSSGRGGRGRGGRGGRGRGRRNTKVIPKLAHSADKHIDASKSPSSTPSRTLGTPTDDSATNEVIDTDTDASAANDDHVFEQSGVNSINNVNKVNSSNEDVDGNQADAYEEDDVEDEEYEEDDVEDEEYGGDKVCDEKDDKDEDSILGHLASTKKQEGNGDRSKKGIIKNSGESKYPSVSFVQLTPEELKEREAKKISKAIDTLKKMKAGLVTLDQDKFAQSCRRFRTGKG